MSTWPRLATIPALLILAAPTWARAEAPPTWEIEDEETPTDTTAEPSKPPTEPAKPPAEPSKPPAEPAKPPSTDEARSPAPPADAPILWPTTWRRAGVALGGGVRLSGYVQAQYQQNELSEDQVQQGGVPLNQDGFTLRRARLRLSGEWDYTGFDLELDANTTHGATVGVRRAVATVAWRSPEAGAPPYLALDAGVLDIPYGFELLQGQGELLYLERTLASRAFFAGPADVGAVLRGGWGPLRYAIGAFSGSPIDTADGSMAYDPTAEPDFSGRLGFETDPTEWFEFNGGVSFLYGTGLSEGAQATKNQVGWQDFNENSSVDAGEVTAVPGQAARPSTTFDRWAVGVDLQLGFLSRIGWTRLELEGSLASNLDRTRFVADPVLAARQIRELSATASVLQELTRWAFVGFRYDYYDPDADYLDERQGVRVAVDYAVHTYAILAGGTLPGIGRLTFEYDVVADKLGRDTRGVPTDVGNNSWALRLHVGF